MASGRWYPTNTTLPNGEVLTVAGTDQNGAVVTIPEIWDGTGWRQLTTASLSLEYYPRDFVAPDGRVFYAGEEQPSRWLDVTRTGMWSVGPRRQYPGWRSYGSAVMYQPGKILYAGGDEQPPTNTAEVIDLNDANPTWRYTGSMAYARRQMNATILPTPAVVGYGQTLTVTTPEGAGITQVTFIRIGSVTHAFDQSGRLVSLAFSQVSGGLAVTFPASRTTAPPGPYMLFLVNANGVPSIGRIMLLQ